MFQSNLPNIFWSYALLHATNLINIIPTPFMKNESPYQKLYSALYDVNLLRVFGCLCYISTLSANRKSWILKPYLVCFWDLNPTRKVTLCIISIHEPLMCLEMSFFMRIAFPSPLSTLLTLPPLLTLPSLHIIHKPFLLL